MGITWVQRHGSFKVWDRLLRPASSDEQAPDGGVRSRIAALEDLLELLVGSFRPVMLHVRVPDGDPDLRRSADAQYLSKRPDGLLIESAGEAGAANSQPRANGVGADGEAHVEGLRCATARAIADAARSKGQPA